MFVSNAATIAGASAAANGVASKITVIAMSEVEIVDKNISFKLDQAFGKALAVLGISDAHHLQVING